MHCRVSKPFGCCSSSFSVLQQQQQQQLLLFLFLLLSFAAASRLIHNVYPSESCAVKQGGGGRVVSASMGDAAVEHLPNQLHGKLNS